MNMIMQDLGLFQLQKPASNSKHAFLGSTETSGLRSEFENLLAGFLGSQAIPDQEVMLTEQDSEGPSDVLLSLIRSESFLFSQESTIDEQDISSSLVLFDQLQAELPEVITSMQQELAALLQPLVGQEISSQNMPEELSDHLVELQQKFSMIFEEMKLANTAILSGISSGEQLNNQTNWLQDFFMFGRITQENAEEFLSFREFLKDFQGTSKETRKLGRELMNILTENNKQIIQSMSEKAGFLKVNAQNDQQKEALAQLLQVSEEEEQPLAVSKNDAGNQARSGSELARQPVVANMVPQETVQVKEELVFQRTLDDTLKFSEEKPVEKVETKELPRFIENQIKNSFRNGENGTREITVRIHPEHLGKLTLKIVSDENREMSVRIMAENRNVKEFLDTNLGNLRTTLENSGIKATSFTLEVDFEKNFNQFSGSNQSNQNQSQQNGKRVIKDEDSQENHVESIFNQSGELEVFA